MELHSNHGSLGGMSANPVTRFVICVFRAGAYSGFLLRFRLIGMGLLYVCVIPFSGLFEFVCSMHIGWDQLLISDGQPDPLTGRRKSSEIRVNYK